MIALKYSVMALAKVAVAVYINDERRDEKDRGCISP
jgi:hypothetical protein